MSVELFDTLSLALIILMWISVILMKRYYDRKIKELERKLPKRDKYGRFKRKEKE